MLTRHIFCSTASAQIKMFVLDEADEMLSRGFKDQIYEIFQKLPSQAQVSTNAFRVRRCKVSADKRICLNDD